MDYEHIERMTAEFSEVDPADLTPDLSAWWYIRTHIAIAQQLAVISKTLKDRAQEDLIP